MDRIARELGLDAVEVRLRNIVAHSEQPARMASGPTMQGATPRETLERMLELVDVQAFRDEQRRAAERRALLGIGFATLVEPAPGPADFGEVTGFGMPPERAAARIEPDGRLTILTGQHPQGQGQERRWPKSEPTSWAFPSSTSVSCTETRRTRPSACWGTRGSRGADPAVEPRSYAVRDAKRQALEIAARMLRSARRPRDRRGQGSVPEARPQEQFRSPTSRTRRTSAGRRFRPRMPSVPSRGPPRWRSRPAVVLGDPLLHR